MKAQNPKRSLVSIDLTGWKITCIEFIPRRRHQTIKTPDLDTVFKARILSSTKEEMNQDGDSTHENDSVGIPVMMPLNNLSQLWQNRQN